MGDVDPKLHRRRAEQKRQIPFPETRLPFLALLGHHLRRVLTRFKHALQFHEVAIALDEVAVHLRGQSALFEQASAIRGAILAITRQPAQRVGVELISRIVVVPAATNLLDDAIALEGEKQESDNLVGLGTPETLIGRQVRYQGGELEAFGPLGSGIGDPQVGSRQKRKL